VPSLSVGDVSVVEGNSGSSYLSFAVTLSQASTSPVTVYYYTSNGTAGSGSVYAYKSGSLTIPAGQTTGFVPVTVYGDAGYEANETFTLTLYSPANATLARTSATGTILDDEPASLLVSNTSVTEGNSGTTLLNYVVTLTQAQATPVTVNYATADGTALAGSDYTAASGTLTFNPGETSKTVAILVNGDTLYEANETFAFNLSSANGATIGRSQAIATITNDDTAPPLLPALSVNDVTLAEGNAGTTNFVFTVTRTGDLSGPSSVNFATADLSASSGAGADYAAQTGTLTVAPGETTKTITVEVKGDNKKEANETFCLDLFGLSQYGLYTKSRGFGTILSDD